MREDILAEEKDSAETIVRLRRLVRFRSPPDRIPFATRSDSVRRSIGFRTPPDQISNAVQSDSVRHPIGFRKQTGEKSWRFLLESKGLAARKQRFGTAKHQQKSSASTDTSIRVGRYEHPRRPMRMTKVGSMKRKRDGVNEGKEECEAEEREV